MDQIYRTIANVLQPSLDGGIFQQTSLINTTWLGAFLKTVMAQPIHIVALCIIVLMIVLLVIEVFGRFSSSCFRGFPSIKKKTLLICFFIFALVGVIMLSISMVGFIFFNKSVKSLREDISYDYPKEINSFLNSSATFSLNQSQDALYQDRHIIKKTIEVMILDVIKLRMPEEEGEKLFDSLVNILQKFEVLLYDWRHLSNFTDLHNFLRLCSRFELMEQTERFLRGLCKGAGNKELCYAIRDLKRHLPGKSTYENMRKYSRVALHRQNFIKSIVDTNTIQEVMSKLQLMKDPYGEIQSHINKLRKIVDKELTQKQDTIWTYAKMTGVYIRSVLVGIWLMYILMLVFIVILFVLFLIGEKLVVSPRVRLIFCSSKTKRLLAPTVLLIFVVVIVLITAGVTATSNEVCRYLDEKPPHRIADMYLNNKIRSFLGNMPEVKLIKPFILQYPQNLLTTLSVSCPENKTLSEGFSMDYPLNISALSKSKNISAYIQRILKRYIGENNITSVLSSVPINLKSISYMMKPLTFLQSDVTLFLRSIRTDLKTQTYIDLADRSQQLLQTLGDISQNKSWKYFPFMKRIIQRKKEQVRRYNVCATSSTKTHYVLGALIQYVENFQYSMTVPDDIANVLTLFDSTWWAILKDETQFEFLIDDFIQIIPKLLERVVPLVSKVVSSLLPKLVPCKSLGILYLQATTSVCSGVVGNLGVITLPLVVATVCCLVLYLLANYNDLVEEVQVHEEATAIELDTLLQ